jgi:hypothetical protein
MRHALVLTVAMFFLLACGGSSGTGGVSGYGAADGADVPGSGEDEWSANGQDGAGGLDGGDAISPPGDTPGDAPGDVDVADLDGQEGDTTEEPCTPGSCVEGQACTADGCVQGDCDGPLDAASCADAGPQGGNCVPIGEGVFRCVAAGEVEVGAACEADEVSCAAGLVCAAGLCEAPCRYEGEDCAEPLTCVPGGTGVEGVGICAGGACEPYSSGQCGTPFLGCLPTSESEGICLPAGDVAEGGACGTEVGLCVEGAACLLDGDGGGSCRVFCAPDAEASATGSCLAEGQRCVDLGAGFFGLCLADCQPWAEPSGCPEGQGCQPQALDGGACFDAGTALLGEACTPPFSPSACAPGMRCVAPDAEAEAGFCEAFCAPFGQDEAAACPADAFCALAKSYMGTCKPTVTLLDLTPGEPCEASGTWCQPNVLCMDLGTGAPKCVSFCQTAAPDCPGGTMCLPTAGDDSALGICF